MCMYVCSSQAYSSVSGSDSDYMPGSSYARKTNRSNKAGKKKKTKRGSSEYEDDYDDELEGFTRTTGRQREFIRYLLLHVLEIVSIILFM